MTSTAELVGPARIVSPVAAFDGAGWDALAGPSFYTSSRWLRACEGLLSERSAVVWVGDAMGQPLAALTVYLVDRDAYLFLNPPALLPFAATQPELAGFQSPEMRARAAALARSVAPSLETRYPVAVCVSPFAFTTTVVGAVAQRGIAQSLLKGFEQVAREWGARASAFLFVPEEEHEVLADTLRAGGYLPATIAARCRLPIRWGSLDEYVASLRKKHRSAVRAEVRAFAASGLSLSLEEGTSLPGVCEDVARLFSNLQRKYGHDPSLAGARETIEWIFESFADVTRVVLVRDGRRPVAFSLFYEVGDTLYGYVVGQAYDARVRKSYAHFRAAYYEVIEQAIRRGVTQIDDGTEGYEVKVLRGYELEPLSGFFRFGESHSEELAGLLRCLDDAQRARFDAYSRYRLFT